MQFDVVLGRNSAQFNKIQWHAALRRVCMDMVECWMTGASLVRISENKGQQVETRKLCHFAYLVTQIANFEQALRESGELLHHTSAWLL